MTFFDWLHKPIPWWVAGPLIGLIVPVLLVLGNKSFGISSSLRHICAACFPANISLFKYDWKKETWNLFFVGGIVLGGAVAATLLRIPEKTLLNPALVDSLSQHGIHNYTALVPLEIFNWINLFTFQGLVMMVVGGFLVGFGTRYAGGCTSGHSIMGLSNLQWPSLVATICFMIGGFVAANFLVPIVLKW